MLKSFIDLNKSKKESKDQESETLIYRSKIVIDNDKWPGAQLSMKFHLKKTKMLKKRFQMLYLSCL